MASTLTIPDIRPATQGLLRSEDPDLVQAGVAFEQSAQNTYQIQNAYNALLGQVNGLLDLYFYKKFLISDFLIDGMTAFTGAIPKEGDRLLVLVLQDPTGGWNVSWSSQFKFNGLAPAPDFTPGDFTTYEFAVAQDVSGVTKDMFFYFVCCGGGTPAFPLLRGVGDVDGHVRVLTGNTAIPLPTDNLNDLVVYILVQDVAGGHTVTWDPGFGADSPGQPDPTPNTFSTFCFLKLGASRYELAWLGAFGQPLSIGAAAANTIEDPHGELVKLIANAAIPMPGGAPGSLFVYLLFQENGGGWTVTWDPSFGINSPGQPDPTVNTYSAFIFIKQTSIGNVLCCIGPFTHPCESGLAAAVTSGRVVNYSGTLSGNLAIPSPADPVGSLILYVVQQDSAGGHRLAWDPVFGTTSPGQPDPTPGKYSAFIFLKTDSSHVRQVGVGIYGRTQ